MQRINSNKENLTENNRTINRKNTLYNAIASGLTAGQSFVILFFVSRWIGLTDAGILTTGFAFAVLFGTIGMYGMRSFQVTDVTEEYSFREYIRSRIYTVCAAFAAFLLYDLLQLIIGNYTPEKALILALSVMLKMEEAFENVYVSRLQQKGRLDLGSEIVIWRVTLSTALICALVVFTKSLTAALYAGVLLSIAADIFLIRRAGLHKEIAREVSRDKIKRLLLTGLPLCISMALYNYIGNAPKYLLDWYADEMTQAMFGYVMMPMFALTILNTFIVQPVVKEIGEYWNRRETERMKKAMKRHFLIIALIAVFVFAVGITIGLPILSWVYAADLGIFRKEFAILMAGGLFYTICSYLMVYLTAIRELNRIILAGAVSILVAIVPGKFFFSGWGTAGISVLYLISNTIMAIMMYYYTMKKINSADAPALLQDDNDETR